MRRISSATPKRCREANPQCAQGQDTQGAWGRTGCTCEGWEVSEFRMNLLFPFGVVFHEAHPISSWPAPIGVLGGRFITLCCDWLFPSALVPWALWGWKPDCYSILSMAVYWLHYKDRGNKRESSYTLRNQMGKIDGLVTNWRQCSRTLQGQSRGSLERTWTGMGSVRQWTGCPGRRCSQRTVGVWCNFKCWENIKLSNSWVSNIFWLGKYLLIIGTHLSLY